MKHSNKNSLKNWKFWIAVKSQWNGIWIFRLAHIHYPPKIILWANLKENLRDVSHTSWWIGLEWPNSVLSASLSYAIPYWLANWLVTERCFNRLHYYTPFLIGWRTDWYRQRFYPGILHVVLFNYPDETEGSGTLILAVWRSRPLALSG